MSFCLFATHKGTETYKGTEKIRHLKGRRQPTRSGIGTIFDYIKLLYFKKNRAIGGIYNICENL